MRQFVITRVEQGAIIDFLAIKLRLSKKRAKRLLDERRVFLNGKRIWMAQYRVSPGDQIEIQGTIELSSTTTGDSRAKTQKHNKSAILYQDDHYLIVNKTPGILTNGPESLETLLVDQLKELDLSAVHRLDRDTSGCVIFAKSQEAKVAAEGLFREKQVTKVYHAIAIGRVNEGIKEIKRPVEGLAAKTKLMVLSSSVVATHLRLSIVTGRMHQIRRHLQAIRHPVIGDKEYVTDSLPPGLLRSVSRQMLHARSLRFVNPFTGREIAVEAPLPADFRYCLRSLRLR